MRERIKKYWAFWLLCLALALVGNDARSQTAYPPLGADTTPRYQLKLSTSGALTIQQPVAPGQKTAVVEAIWVYCATAQSFTISQNGTGATSTAATIAALNHSPPSTIKAWSASNASSFAYTSDPYYVGAGSTYTLGFGNGSMFLVQNGGVNENITVTPSGTCDITIQWIEK